MNRKSLRYTYGPEDEIIFIITDKGYGLKLPLSEMHITARDSLGLKAISLVEKNGHVVAAKKVKPGELITILTRYGYCILMNENNFRLARRKNIGAKAVTLKGGDEVVALV